MCVIADMPKYKGPSVELADMSHKDHCYRCGCYRTVWSSYSGIRNGEYIDPECRQCVEEGE